ncbi:aminomethyltransferase [Prolixibacter bellariivorans]|uniref:Aminomethyltransferase n=1 Tax=Prolixibacter bellariivorans TaxID=314319 RepID=A0A5M4AVE4_9BACT|nr:glycine cleavage system aminomethyltransferase GcvT [Prolixibacter bellariivorans]GET31764.1 aminomethyltransferase [Prolixibacter bellariivorans]
MKRTAFFDIHNSNGAKIVEFAGFEMPIEYSGIKDEHMTVRNGVGVFDVSHMGEFWVTGPHALAFIQKVTSNDASKLAPGQAQYSCLPNGKGGIVDDLIVYCFEPEKYLLVVNAANIEKDWQWLVSQNTEEAEMLNASDEISQLAIQGPKATGILQKLTKVDLSSIKFYTFTVGEFAGVPDVIISATGYTGAGGFELYFNNKDAEAIWSAIFDAGKEEGIKPIGLGARDTLRLEMGYCLYGNDIDDTTSPIEAGLGWITKFTDEKDFIDKDVLARQKEEGVTRRLRGFEMIDRGIPRHGYEIVNENDEVIGEVTSGSMSPVRGIGIGMGYLKTGYTKLGTEIYIRVRNKKLKAKVVKLPFI